MNTLIVAHAISKKFPNPEGLGENTGKPNGSPV